MDRAEAEAIYDAGREVVVEVLLAMDRRIQQLEARVEKLERQLAKSSRNSSLPPSSDPPGKTPRRSKDRSGRKRGGQPGHEGRGRDLLPACAVDEVIEHWPERCGCGHVFSVDERRQVGEPARHQVEELPAIMVRVIEHRAQRVHCPECGAPARGEPPREVAGSVFGPPARQGAHGAQRSLTRHGSGRATRQAFFQGGRQCGVARRSARGADVNARRPDGITVQM